MATTIQKCVLVSDKLAVAWAGDYSPARRIILEATQYFDNHRRITVSDVKNFLATQSYEDQMKVQLVGLCVSDDNVGSFALHHSTVLTKAGSIFKFPMCFPQNNLLERVSCCTQKEYPFGGRSS